MKVWRVALRSTGADGTLLVNTLGIRVVETPTDNFDASGAAVADAVDTWLRSSYLGLLSPQLTLQDITVDELSGDHNETSVKTIAQVGTLPNSTGNLPVEVCGVLSFRTAFATRRQRGRIFCPSPMQSGQLLNPDLWATTGTTYGARCIAFGAAYVAGTTFTEGGVNYNVEPVIWSRVGLSATLVTSALFRTRPHWLRSRSTAP